MRTAVLAVITRRRRPVQVEESQAPPEPQPEEQSVPETKEGTPNDEQQEPE